MKGQGLSREDFGSWLIADSSWEEKIRKGIRIRQAKIGLRIREEKGLARCRAPRDDRVNCSG